MSEHQDVPMSLPDVRDDDAAAVLEVLRSPVLSGGPRLDQFERAIAERVGVAHAVGVSSGTAGLHLAVLAAGVRDGDAAITTPLPFVASANVILYDPALPVCDAVVPC